MAKRRLKYLKLKKNLQINKDFLKKLYRVSGQTRQKVIKNCNSFQARLLQSLLISLVKGEIPVKKHIYETNPNQIIANN